MPFRKWTLLACFLFVITLLSWSSSSRPVVAASKLPTASPNIIFIIVDTLRADHTTPYGYSRDTTPNLNTLIASQGVRFADVTSVAPWTSPAISSLFTGLIENSYGMNWQHEDARIPDSTKTLATYLSQGGYATAGFASSVLSASKGFGQGFDRYQDKFDTPPGRFDRVRAEQINQAALDWLKHEWLPSAASNKPLFLMLHYFDPHSWYEPPAPFDTRYDPTYTGTVTSEAFGIGKAVMSGELKLTPRDVEHIIALYDGEIAYWDDQLGLLFKELDSLHLLDNTVIAVVADHGEMFGEHGTWLHRTSLYEETLRVPLLIRYTGVISPGSVISTPIQSMDVMPTLLDLAAQPIPEALDAVDERPLLEGAVPVAGRLILSKIDAVTDTAHSSYWINPHFDLRSMRQNSYKLINKPEEPSADELFQLKPTTLYETDNLLSQQPAQAELLRWQLYSKLGEGASLSGHVTDLYGTAVSGVELQLNANIYGISTGSGVYTVSHLPPQDYLFAPALAGFSFWPPTRTVTVASADLQQDFVALGAEVSTTLMPTLATQLIYSDTLDLPTRIEFPAAVVSATTELALIPRLVNDGSGLTALGPAFILQASQSGQLVDLTSKQPFTISLSYSDQLFLKAGDEAKSGVYWWNGDQWQIAEQSCASPSKSKQNLAKNQWTVAVCQSGMFALMAPSHRLYLPTIQSINGNAALAYNPPVPFCVGEQDCSEAPTLQFALDEAMRHPTLPVTIALTPGIYTNWNSTLAVRQKQWTQGCVEANYGTSFLLAGRNAPT